MFYDPMIAKLCSWGKTRDLSINRMETALDNFLLEGIDHNISFLSAILANKRFKSGDINIVVGTHALLSNDIDFNNLGLLIVDEEQHFGVAQKEKIKELQGNIHVLTLTATPIPRTLQLSLSGLKQLSLISTPPVDLSLIHI